MNARMACLVGLVLALSLPTTLGSSTTLNGVTLSTDRDVYHHYDLRPARGANEMVNSGGASRVHILFTNGGPVPVTVGDCDSWWATDLQGETIARARFSLAWGYAVPPGGSVRCIWDLWSDDPARSTTTGLVPAGEYLVHWWYLDAAGTQDISVPLRVENGFEAAA